MFKLQEQRYLSGKCMKKYRNYAEEFLLYCIIGWLYEVIWCNIIEENIGFENRGYLFGPWLPIYGVGMFLILYIFYKFDIKTPGKMFVVGALTACTAELIGSYFLDLIAGGFLWDYSKDFMNFEGRIALRPELYFGFLILLAMYVVKPRFNQLQEKYSENLFRNIFSVVLVSLFLIDLIARLKLGSNF